MSMRVYEVIWDQETREFCGSYREACMRGREYKGGELIAHIQAHDFKPTKKDILRLLNHLG
jgi:hypothetical protein